MKIIIRYINITKIYDWQDSIYDMIFVEHTRNIKNRNING